MATTSIPVVPPASSPLIQLPPPVLPLPTSTATFKRPFEALAGSPAVDAVVPMGRGSSTASSLANSPAASTADLPSFLKRARTTDNNSDDASKNQRQSLSPLLDQLASAAALQEQTQQQQQQHFQQSQLLQQYLLSTQQLQQQQQQQQQLQQQLFPMVMSGIPLFFNPATGLPFMMFGGPPGSAAAMPMPVPMPMSMPMSLPLPMTMPMQVPMPHPPMATAAPIAVPTSLSTNPSTTPAAPAAPLSVPPTQPTPSSSSSSSSSTGLSVLLSGIERLEQPAPSAPKNKSQNKKAKASSKASAPEQQNANSNQNQAPCLPPISALFSAIAKAQNDPRSPETPSSSSDLGFPDQDSTAASTTGDASPSSPTAVSSDKLPPDGLTSTMDRYYRAANETVFTIRTACVAQKSYGVEKRFLCPPPMVQVSGVPSSSVNKQLLRVNIINEDGSRGVSQQAMLDEQGRTSFKYLHVTDAFKSKMFSLRFKLNGADDSMPTQSLISKPITIISKPSKKTSKTGNNAMAIVSGATVCFFNRVNSQTVRTKYMTVDDRRLSAKNSSWSTFEILAVNPDNTVDVNGFVINYGSLVILRNLETGVYSDMLLIKKAAKDVIIHDSVGPVSQMQKIALVHPTMPNMCLSIVPATSFNNNTPYLGYTPFVDGKPLDNHMSWTIVGVEKTQYKLMSKDAPHSSSVPSESTATAGSGGSGGAIDADTTATTDGASSTTGSSASPTLPSPAQVVPSVQRTTLTPSRASATSGSSSSIEVMDMRLHKNGLDIHGHNLTSAASIVFSVTCGVFKSPAFATATMMTVVPPAFSVESEFSSMAERTSFGQSLVMSILLERSDGVQEHTGYLMVYERIGSGLITTRVINP